MKKVAQFFTFLKQNKKTVAIAIVLAVGSFLAGKYTTASREVISEKEVYIDDSFSASVRKDTIQVSEADSEETRTKAYANNVTIRFNDQELNLKGGEVNGKLYTKGSVVIRFEEKDDKVVARIGYGKFGARVGFTANEHKLINDANGNTVYNSPSYAMGFDENGQRTGSRHLITHESDLDANGNTIGVQNEKLVKMKEEVENKATGIVTGRPESHPVKKEKTESQKQKEAEERDENSKKEYYSSDIHDEAHKIVAVDTGKPDNEKQDFIMQVDMSKVEDVPEEIASNPQCMYAQIVIMNTAEGSLNLVSTNGGNGTLGVILQSIEGNTYHCTDREGNSIDIVISVDASGNYNTTYGIYR